MPDFRQKYGLRVALRPQNAFEGVTYMDIKAVDSEIERARKADEDAKFECVNIGNDEVIHVRVPASDIQIVMHHKWERPVQVQQNGPEIRGIPNLRSVQ